MTRRSIMFDNRTAQCMADLLALQPRKIERDRALIQGAAGLSGQFDAGKWIPGIGEVAKGDYGLSKLGIEQAWKDLDAALALPNMKTATEGLNLLSGAISSIGKEVQGMDPSTVQAITVAIAGVLTVTLVTALGALAAVGGSGQLGSCAYRLAGGRARRLLQVGPDHRLRAEPGQPDRSGLMAIPGMVIGAISAMASGIANAIKGAISSLGRALTPNGGGGQHQEVVPDGFGGMTPAPQCWTPPPRANGMQETRVNINLDGYRLGEAVAYHVARANTHVAAAGKCDSGAMHMPVDLQTA